VRGQRIAAVLSGAGVVALFLAWLWKDSLFLLGVMINVGTGLLLFAALSLVLESYLARQEVRQAQLVRDVEERVRTSLETVGEETRQALRARHKADEGALDSFAQDVWFETARDMLERAERIGCIAPTGVRVAIPDVDKRLCFALSVATDHSDRTIRVSLQEWDGQFVARYEWGPREEVSALLVEVADDLVRMGDYPGDDKFDSEAIMRELHDSVALAMRSRAGDGGMPRIGRLIEVLGTWALTDLGLESCTREYLVPISRLGEKRWAERIRKESWTDPEEFLIALDLAAAYHRGPASSPDDRTSDQAEG
jgi:hypothetical protein